MLDQLILADDPVGVLRKVEEQVEDLRLDVNDSAVAPLSSRRSVSSRNLSN
jgi:hypothetical protein